MKRVVFILVILGTGSVAAQQTKDLIGTWTLVERTQLDFGSSPWTRSESDLKAEGLYQTMTFMDEGKTEVIAKYHNTDTITAWQAWKATEDILTLTGGPAEKTHTINWNYELQGDLLILTLYSKDGKGKIVNTWRRKED